MKQRIRILYSKDIILRYTSTLDMQKMWERILRRAEFPLVYSKGFHPQPKIQLACPLPLGLTSQAEIVDFWLEETFDAQYLLTSLNRSINQGITITKIESVAINEPAMQTRLLSSIYHASIQQNSSLESINQEIDRILNAHEIIRTRRNKKYDLRPLIECLEADMGEENIEIMMQLSIRSGGPHGRPDEVLAALGLDPLQSTIQRINVKFTE